MENFGILKEQIIGKLAKLYEQKDYKKIKKILNLIKEDKNFKDLYLFYDNVENIFVNDDLMEEYLNEVIKNLQKMKPLINETTNKIKKEVDDIEPAYNELYKNLDILSEELNINNTDKFIYAKNQLKNYLLKPKEVKKPKSYTVNEGLLYSILTNNFNLSYNNALTESEKKELRTILSIDNEDIKNNISELKEDVLNIVDNLITEDETKSFNEKLNNVKIEVEKMTPSRVNYFRLKNLKQNLIEEN